MGVQVRCSCLHVAAYHGHLDIVKHLVREKGGGQLAAMQTADGSIAHSLAVKQAKSKVEAFLQGV